ncbi:hypothetical protein CBR_g40793 [Chara braunii]|uniref:BZIP domain-containing protein n=1 Tax=Chara braunii TaxID=69332 RepID=A0A388LUI7_CHABU|nr:hypothetical protein CBR_g40793 [Chara braunii]|eukprot:GBG85980.1 hypothetical protein CBR_g40793 [Chara braunii]
MEEVCLEKQEGEGDAFRFCAAELSQTDGDRDRDGDARESIGAAPSAAEAVAVGVPADDLLSFAETMISCPEEDGDLLSMGFADGFSEPPAAAAAAAEVVASTVDISRQFELMEKGEGDEGDDLWGIMEAVDMSPEGDAYGMDDEWLCLLADSASAGVEDEQRSSLVPLTNPLDSGTEDKPMDIEGEGGDLRSEGFVGSHLVNNASLLTAASGSSLCSSLPSRDSCLGICIPVDPAPSRVIDGDVLYDGSGARTVSPAGIAPQPVRVVGGGGDAAPLNPPPDVSSAPVKFPPSPSLVPHATVDGLRFDGDPKGATATAAGKGGTSAVRSSTAEAQNCKLSTDSAEARNCKILTDCVERPVPVISPPEQPLYGSDSSSRHERDCSEAEENALSGRAESPRECSQIARKTNADDALVDERMGDAAAADGSKNSSLEAVHLVASDKSAPDPRSSGSDFLSTAALASDLTCAQSSMETAAQSSMVIATSRHLLAPSDGGTSQSPAVEQGRVAAFQGGLGAHSFSPCMLPDSAAAAPRWSMTRAAAACTGELVDTASPRSGRSVACALPPAAGASPQSPPAQDTSGKDAMVRRGDGAAGGGEKTTAQGLPGKFPPSETSAAGSGDGFVNDTRIRAPLATKATSAKSGRGGGAQGAGYGMAKRSNDLSAAAAGGGERRTSPASSERNASSPETCRSGGGSAVGATSSLCSRDSGAGDDSGNDEQQFSAHGDERHAGPWQERECSRGIGLDRDQQQLEQQQQQQQEQQQQQHQQQREDRRSSSSSSTSVLNPSSPEGGEGVGQGEIATAMVDYNDGGGGGENSDEGVKSANGEADKKQARLLRNRESAQLSRQRKKVYVDDLENRLRTMAATIAELNATIAHLTADNVALRRQLGYFYPAPPGGGAPPAGIAAAGGPIIAGGGVGSMCGAAQVAHMYGGSGAPMMLPRHPGVMPPLGVASMFGHGGQAPPIPIPRWPSHRAAAAASAAATGSKKQKGKRSASREAEKEASTSASAATATAAAPTSDREKKRTKRDSRAVLTLSLFCFVLVFVPFGGLWDWSPLSPFAALPESRGGTYIPPGGRGGGGVGVGSEHDGGRILVDSGGGGGGRPPGGRVLMGLGEESGPGDPPGDRREEGEGRQDEGGEMWRRGNATILQPPVPLERAMFLSGGHSPTVKPSSSSARDAAEKESLLILNRTVIGRNTEIVPASLIVPRGHEIVRVYGNLIIQSVMAGDKAAWGHREGNGEAKGGGGREGGGMPGNAMSDTDRHQLKAMASLSINGGGDGGAVAMNYPTSGNALPASASERSGQGQSSAGGRPVAPGQLGSSSGSGLKGGEERRGQASSRRHHHHLDHYPSHHHHYENTWIFGPGGLSGPVLTSGVCTELFQFETSSSSIVPDVVVGTSTEEEEAGQGGAGAGGSGTISWKKAMEGRVAAMAATEAARRAAAVGSGGSVRMPTTGTIEKAEAGNGDDLNLTEAMGQTQGKHGYYDYGRKGGRCVKDKRVKPLPSASAGVNATAVAMEKVANGGRRANGSQYEDRCTREDALADVRVGARSRGGGEVGVNGSDRRSMEGEEDPTGRSFGYGGSRTDKSLPSTMVVSVLLPSMQPGEDSAAGGGRGGGGSSTGKNGGSGSGPGKLTQIFVVVLVNSVKYVTYSCLLPTLSATAAAMAGPTAAAGAAAAAAAGAGVL